MSSKPDQKNSSKNSTKNSAREVEIDRGVYIVKDVAPKDGTRLTHRLTQGFGNGWSVCDRPNELNSEKIIGAILYRRAGYSVLRSLLGTLVIFAVAVLALAGQGLLLQLDPSLGSAGSVSEASSNLFFLMLAVITIVMSGFWSGWMLTSIPDRETDV